MSADSYEEPHDECYIEGCGRLATYIIEWHGVNQHGENPLVVGERPVCDNIKHIVTASEHEDYGGVPDGIVDYKTESIEHPDLLEEVIQKMKEQNLI